MLKFTLSLLAIMLLSCHDNFHSPTEKEIEKAVSVMYEKRNEAAGGGGWVIKEVKIIRSWKGDDERHYNAEVVVKGIHTSPPLATRRPDEDIDETRKIHLIWRDGGWIGIDE